MINEKKPFKRERIERREEWFEKLKARLREAFEKVFKEIENALFSPTPTNPTRRRLVWGLAALFLLSAYRVLITFFLMYNENFR